MTVALVSSNPESWREQTSFSDEERSDAGALGNSDSRAIKYAQKLDDLPLRRESRANKKIREPKQ